MNSKDPLAAKRRRVIDDYQKRLDALRAKQIALAQKILNNANQA